jgi:hypothetical protein
MDRTNDYFLGLQEIVGTEEVQMSGAWNVKRQRRYASPTQSGTGEGPFIETFDWRWEGTFLGSSPLVGLALLSSARHTYWAKSAPPGSCPEVCVLVTGWVDASHQVSATGSFHGSGLPSIPVAIHDEPPVSCIIGASRGSVGIPHVVMRLEPLVFSVLLLPASAIKVGRKRLWHLREKLASGIPPSLRQILTRRRSGQIDWTD